MADIAHVWGQDLQLGPTGDLAVVAGDGETQQRIIHRLLTNTGDYIWQLAYGAGLPAMVGQVVNGPAIAAIVRAQLLLEGSVAPSPEPVVTIAATPDGTVTLSIRYADATTGATQILSLPVGS
jgi:phage baseplate assembly protein W